MHSSCSLFLPYGGSGTDLLALQGEQGEDCLLYVVDIAWGFFFSSLFPGGASGVPYIKGFVEGSFGMEKGDGDVSFLGLESSGERRREIHTGDGFGWWMRKSSFWEMFSLKWSRFFTFFFEQIFFMTKYKKEINKRRRGWGTTT